MLVAVLIGGQSVRSGPCGLLLAKFTMPIPLWIFGALGGMVLVLFVVVMALRRYALAGRDSDDGGLTIEQLDEMHRKGMISREEYKQAKLAIMAPVLPADVAARLRDSTAGAGRQATAPEADDGAEGPAEDPPDAGGDGEGEVDRT